MANYIESMAARPETFYTRKICNYLIIRIKQLLFVQLLNGLNIKERFEEELSNIESALHKKGGTKKIEKVWERIGRAKEKNSRVSAQYQIDVERKEGR